MVQKVGPALTHVVECTEDGWVPVTAGEMRARGVNQGISYESGRFLCTLCYQYATLTKNGHNQSHFRHPPNILKSCPEKTEGKVEGYQFSYSFQVLPLKLAVHQEQVQFLLGFPTLPPKILAEAQDRGEWVCIQRNGKKSKKILISQERFYRDTMTYLPIGEEIPKKISLEYSNPKSCVIGFWGRDIGGTSGENVVFGKKSGKKIPEESDVFVNVEYFLLTRNPPDDPMVVDMVAVGDFHSEGYRLYCVKAKDFTIESAQFFQELGVRLVKERDSLVPVWPPVVMREHRIIMDKDTKNIFMMYHGEGTIRQNYPKGRTYTKQSKGLYKISRDGFQQVVALGRNQLLEYFYLSTEQLPFSPTEQGYSIFDKHRNPVEEDILDKPPESGELRVQSDIDGCVKVYKQGVLTKAMPIKADVIYDLNNLKLGMEVQLYQGLDLVRRIVIEKTQSEREFLNRLQSATGKDIAIGHSVGAVAQKWADSPMVVAWIRQCIRRGSIKAGALRDLKTERK